MLTIKDNTQLEAEERAAIETERQQALPVVTMLAAYVRKSFEDAELHRQTTGVTERLLKSRRMKSGRYDEAKLAAIQAKGGSALFFNITETKCEAFEAWLEDVFAPVGDRPWDAQPTPIPSLPQGSVEAVVEATVAQFQNAPEASPEEIQQFAIDLYEETLRQMCDEAKKTCERMVRKMEDQTAEGGFADALTEFIGDLGTYPSAILKGPVFVRKQRLAWQNGQVQVAEEIVPTWQCVDPFAFYPGPNARRVDESYMCELIDLDRRLLSEMRGVEGWNSGAIESVLSSAPATMQPYVAGESEKAILENRTTNYNNGMPDATVRAIEFWGSVPGSMLAEWGMQGIADAFQYYEVNCILVGNVVVKAILNPDPLGRRPYYVDSFIRNKNSLWGLKSIPEKMEDCQEGVNGAQRNLLNNLAIASGPQVAADLDAIPAQHVPTLNQLYPWKVWLFHGTKTQKTEPVRFFQPQSNAAELIEVSEYYEKKSDDRTLIPRYVYGNENLNGAGQTASGLSMLMNAAARGIKRVIKGMDRNVLRPAVERLYTWNMCYLDDPAIKGDVQVIPRGALALLVREQVQIRRQEFLQMTNNPTDLQIIGIQGRAALLREVARGLDIPVEKIVPSEEELRRQVEAQLAQQGVDGEGEGAGSEEAEQ